ncbi:arylesterase [Salegentibacter mishustinae]|uniref:GDSL family lipase n=1 Tax=Salegentibacter mishustinae TaxID=270918 RepID=A0A0Q9Z7P9_9FLAO|nr:arylesterase [Salegentibacter mishustinae]KRG28981.1 GDSL family lipase [Salegentibacter mishustinae]PNW21967.1 GDSL family lipase [Salegentibacter mishustinae]PZX65322.1 acyl-CoA thioesterase-1 [Salegentibacter mishustinae]
MRNLIRYSSILLMFLMFSCGENTEKKSEKNNTEEAQTETETQDSEKDVILFFGNSLTAGMGLEPSEAFPALIQNRLDSLDYDYEVINAGLSGETTASGKNRINWVLNQDVDVFVLELGANDGLRGIPLEETRKNLQDIINTVKDKNPKTKIVLAGMQIPPNMGEEYTTEFRNIFPELAEENNLELIPFLLEGVAGDPKLNQQDGIHPTAEGYEIVADNVWSVLEDVVEKE